MYTDVSRYAEFIDSSIAWQGESQADVPTPSIQIDGEENLEEPPVLIDEEDILTTRGPGAASTMWISIYLLSLATSLPIVFL